MKYAFNTWAYSSFPAWLPSYPLDEAIRRIAAIGYDGVEIGCAAPHAWPGYLNKERRAELPLAEERDATVRYYTEVIDLALDLGAEKVLYIAGWQIFGTSRQQAWDRSKDCLDQIASHADEKGITIVVEPTAAATNLIETADDAMELMRSVARDNVKVMFDTLHALYRNEIPADYVRTMREDLVHVHVSDSGRVIPGEGRVDWIGLMQALNECGYNGYLTMEIGLDSRAADPDQIARTALKFLKGVESQLNRYLGR